MDRLSVFHGNNQLAIVQFTHQFDNLQLLGIYIFFCVRAFDLFHDFTSRGFIMMLGQFAFFRYILIRRTKQRLRQAEIKNTPNHKVWCDRFSRNSFQVHNKVRTDFNHRRYSGSHLVGCSEYPCACVTSSQVSSVTGSLHEHKLQCIQLRASSGLSPDFLIAAPADYSGSHNGRHDAIYSVDNLLQNENAHTNRVSTRIS